MNKYKYNSLASVQERIHALLALKNPIIVALDGKSGVGKSTVAAKIAKLIDVAIVNCDDFYSGPDNKDEESWHKKTPNEKIDQVLDYEKIKNEVVLLLLSNKSAEYHPFNFQAGYGLSKELIELNPAPVIVLDGVYSVKHLQGLTDISVLVDCPDDVRRIRLLEREGKEFMLDWHSKWDEAEDFYFNEVMSDKNFDFIVNGLLQ